MLGNVLEWYEFAVYGYLAPGQQRGMLCELRGAVSVLLEVAEQLSGDFPGRQLLPRIRSCHMAGLLASAQYTSIAVVRAAPGA